MTFKPTISEIIEGSFKEGFVILWSQIGNEIEIELNSLPGYIQEACMVVITEDLQKYYPGTKVKFV